MWSEEEDEGGEAAESDDDSSIGEDKRPMNQLQRADSSGSENDEVMNYEIHILEKLKLWLPEHT